MDILKFVNEALLILVGVIYVLGIFLKRTPKVPDWLFLWVLLGISIILTISYNGYVVEGKFDPPVIMTGIVQGVIITGVAVLGNQLIKQTQKGVRGDKSSGDEDKPEGGTSD